MIIDSQLADIGKFIKPHGIAGEISAVVDADVDIDSLRCIVVDIDGIFVPFFITGCRSRGSEAVLLQLEGVENEVDAKSFSGKSIYALLEDLPEDEGHEEVEGFYASDFIGWTMVDGGAELGRIDDVDDTTENVLFVVEMSDGRTVYVPVADEFIVAVDGEHQILEMSLPDGLMEL